MTKESHVCTNVKVVRHDKTSEVEVSADIPAAILAAHREKALASFTTSLELPGFRKGKAPKEAVLKHVGEGPLLMEAAERAISDELPKVFASEKLLVIDTPQVTLGSVSLETPLHFSAKAPLPPSVKLPDYAKIAKKHPAPEGDFAGTEEEIADALNHLKRERMRIELMEGGMEHGLALETSKKTDAKELTDLDDAFVQSLGFENVVTFTESVKTNIASEKKRAAEEKRRSELLEALVEASDISLPPIMISWETDEIEAQFKEDVKRMGATWENYLKLSGKTREEVRESWKGTAEKRVKTRLILDAIAGKEEIVPSQEAIDHELKHLKEHHPGGDEAHMRAYVTRAKRTEAVIRFLETGEK